MGRWITSKGRHIYIPDEGEIDEQQYRKDRQIAENKKQADEKNETPAKFKDGDTPENEKKRDTEKILPVIRKITGSPSELTEDERKEAESYVTKYGKEQGTLYRGLDLTDGQVKKLKVGEEFPMENRLTSYTPDRDSAEAFAKRHLNDYSYFGNNAVILKDDNGFGVDISGMSKYETENEVLVNNSSNYIIKAIDKITGKNPGSRGYLEDVEITIVTVERKKGN